MNNWKTLRPFWLLKYNDTKEWEKTMFGDSGVGYLTPEAQVVLVMWLYDRRRNAYLAKCILQIANCKVYDVLTTHNPGDYHGKTSSPTEKEIEDRR